MQEGAESSGEGSAAAAESAARMRVRLQWNEAQKERRNVAVFPPHVQHLQKMLDLTPFLNETTKLLATAIKVPGMAAPMRHPTGAPIPGRHGIFSVKGIFREEKVRLREVSKLLGNSDMPGRQWLKQILMEESDSDDESQLLVTEKHLHNIIKMRKTELKMRKKFHTKRRNRKLCYFSSGAFSSFDPFPETYTAFRKAETASRRKAKEELKESNECYSTSREIESGERCASGGSFYDSEGETKAAFPQPSATEESTQIENWINES